MLRYKNNIKKKGMSDMVLGLIISLAAIILLVIVITNISKSANKNVQCGGLISGTCEKTCSTGKLPTLDIGDACANRKDGLTTCCAGLDVSKSTTSNDNTGNELCQTRAVGADCSTQQYFYKVCNATKQCVYKCEYCAQNPGVSGCAGFKSNNDKLVTFNSQFSCGCSKDQCTEKSKTGKCLINTVPQGFFCSPNLYCCEVPNPSG
jgi:hypothetical protein